MYAIAAALTLLALETKAVADARRLRAAFAGVTRAIQGVGAAFAQLGRLIADALVKITDAVRQVIPAGYYWRDGKLRRDHGYFRRRAKLRRAALKAERRPANVASKGGRADAGAPVSPRLGVST